MDRKIFVSYRHKDNNVAQLNTSLQQTTTRDYVELAYNKSMKYKELRRHLGKSHLTIGIFSELIKLNPNSITNYSKLGTVPSNLAVIATLMSEMADNQLDFQKPLESIDISPNKVRGGAIKGGFGGLG